MPADHTHPYAALTPDVVLDALAGIGLYGDGRLLALSSYENRVYQVVLEDGAKVVAKFYRPGRWSAAQITEEQDFALQLAAAEVPVVAPLPLGAGGRSLHQHGGFFFSISPWRGGRAPELEDPEVLEWIGRFLARLHQVGSAQPFSARAPLSWQRWGQAAQAALLASGRIAPQERSSWQDACSEAIEMIAAGAFHQGSGSRFCLISDIPQTHAAPSSAVAWWPPSP